jgi:hypothetical protein
MNGAAATLLWLALAFAMKVSPKPAKTNSR